MGTATATTFRPKPARNTCSSACFAESALLTRLNQRVHIDDRPDQAFIYAQDDYQAEQLTRTATADKSTATDYNPGAAGLSHPDTVIKPIQVRRLSRPTVCQQQSQQHQAVKSEIRSHFAILLLPNLQNIASTSALDNG